jgi:orotidine-5'-phosphate decarboxylase
MNFKDSLFAITKENISLVCVGLDSQIDKIPEHLKKVSNPQFEFNKLLIEATHDLVCTYKPNTAFYEANGTSGIEQLKLTIHYIKENYPEIPVILDAKRADIGNTNEGYAKFAFDYLRADAITVHPYLGKEALKPFLDRKDKGIIVLCRTSNPGAGEFQDLENNGKHLYQTVAENVTNQWNYNGNCALVVGATYPEELKNVREMAKNIPILIPGVGAQGGDVEKTVKAGVDENGLNAIINSSRGIIFASKDNDFAEKAREETVKLKDLINSFRRII